MESIFQPSVVHKDHVHKEKEVDFATQGRVVHVRDGETGERLVGVQFTGPRFRRLFQRESAA